VLSSNAGNEVFSPGQFTGYPAADCREQPSQKKVKQKIYRDNKYMKANLFCLVLLVGMLLPLFTVRAEEPKAVAMQNKVAKVNDSVITEAELNRELAMTRQRYAEKGKDLSADQLTELKKDVLDRLVRRELIFGVCRKDGIKAEPSEVDQTFQMVKARFSDDEAFRKMMDQFNLTEDIIRSDIAREIAIKKLIEQRFVKNVTVSEAEAKKYYEKSKENFHQPESVKASQILIKVPENATPEEKEKARARILEIKKKLDEGADFAALAKQFSEGPRAANAGDLGYFRRGQMVKPFEDAAFALKPGEISDVVETRFGYHLIKVTDRTNASIIPFDELHERIAVYLKQQKLQSMLTNYVEELKKTSTVVIY